MLDADSHGWGTDHEGWGDGLWGSRAEVGPVHWRRGRFTIDPLVYEGLISRRR
jgi:hypothetical protein